MGPGQLTATGRVHTHTHTHDSTLCKWNLNRVHCCRDSSIVGCCCWARRLGCLFKNWFVVIYMPHYLSKISVWGPMSVPVKHYHCQCRHVPCLIIVSRSTDKKWQTRHREREGSVKKGPFAIENSICKCQWQFSWCRLWPYLYHAIYDFLLPGCPFLLAFSPLNRKSSVDLKATSCPTVCLPAWWAVPLHVGVGWKGGGWGERQVLHSMTFVIVGDVQPNRTWMLTYLLP